MTIKTIDIENVTPEMIKMCIDLCREEYHFDICGNGMISSIFYNMADIAQEVSPPGYRLQPISEYDAQEFVNRENDRLKAENQWLKDRFATIEQITAKENHSEHNLDMVKPAKAAPVECEPVGYVLTELSGQPREDDGELYVYSHPFACNDKTDCRPVYFYPRQGIDTETSTLVLALCNKLEDMLRAEWSANDDDKDIIEINIIRERIGKHE